MALTLKPEDDGGFSLLYCPAQGCVLCIQCISWEKGPDSRKRTRGVGGRGRKIIKGQFLEMVNTFFLGGFIIFQNILVEKMGAFRVK